VLTECASYSGKNGQKGSGKDRKDSSDRKRRKEQKRQLLPEWAVMCRFVGGFGTVRDGFNSVGQWLTVSFRVEQAHNPHVNGPERQKRAEDAERGRK